MTDKLFEALASGVQVYDLSRLYEIGMPQSPNHPAYWRSMPRRHGDRVRDDGGSAANDLIVMGTHVGTHMDALGHVSHDGLLYGDVQAADEQVGGGFPTHGIDAVAPLFTRGVLLDIPAVRGVTALEGGDEISPEDLDAALERHDGEVCPGEVLLIRSGWGQRWHDRDAYIGHDSGVPGVSAAGARWLAARRPAAVGADTIAFEHLPAGKGHAVLPAHRILLVEEGINIIETMDLERLALDGVDACTLVLAPLPLVGATGAPVRPLAVVSDGSPAEVGRSGA